LFLPGIELCFHGLQHVAQSVYRLHCFNSLSASIHNNLRTIVNYRRDFITLGHFHLETVLAKGHVERDHAISRRLDSFMIGMMIVTSTDSLVYTVTTASCDCMFRGSNLK
jgi:CRISPR/Cas system-associated endoribonuclease Cas2